MKLIRIIPTLLIKNSLMYKGKKFHNHRYLGDIFNAIKIFSEKKSHEIILLDIDARINNQINYDLINKIRKKTFVPLAYGGGINDINQISQLISKGLEKVVLNSICYKNYNLISEAAAKFGSQSITVSVDIKKEDNQYILFSQSGKKKEKINLYEHLKNCQNYGAGEFIITSIDLEGSYKGYDLNLYKYVQDIVSLPVIASGGAGSINDMKELFSETNLSSAAAGSMFVFFGEKEAVLINYPNQIQLENIMSAYE